MTELRRELVKYFETYWEAKKIVYLPTKEGSFRFNVDFVKPENIKTPEQAAEDINSIYVSLKGLPNSPTVFLFENEKPT